MLIPVPSRLVSMSGADEAAKQECSTVQFKDVRCSGTLRMTARKTYAKIQRGLSV